MTVELKQETPRPGAALKTARRTLVGLGVFSFFINMLMLTGPLYMLQVYDRVLSSASIPTLLALTGLVAGLYVTLGLLDWVRQSVFSIVGSRFEHQLADQALNASMAARLRDPGVQKPRVLQDLRTLRRFFSGPVPAAMFDAPFSPIFFAALFLLHHVFGLWALFGVAVLVSVAIVNQLISRKAAKEAEQLEAASHNRAAEMTGKAEIIKALGMAAPLQARWRAELDRSDASITASAKTLGAFTAGTKAFRLFLQSAILGLGAWLAIIGQSTPGAMIAASILMGRAIAPIEQLVSQWRSVIQAGEAWRSVRDQLERAPRRGEPMPLPALAGRVDFEDVFAGPPSLEKPILKRLSFSLAPGDTLGVIGSSASGKSTLARVLTGVWPVAGGAVRLDGAELSAFAPESLGPQLGYLPQHVELFAGTVRDNISRFAPDASPEAVVAAAQAAGCHELILRLPEGYDTEIGDNGCYLSAGQRQRVGLARALYGDPAIVVLDEPNSNLDSEGDQALQTAIGRRKAQGATTVVIAHRPSAVTHCTKMLVLEDGMVRLFGPRDEVLAQMADARKKSQVTPIRLGDANV